MQLKQQRAETPLCNGVYRLIILSVRFLAFAVYVPKFQ
jgi:hypothetical protein